MIGNSAKKLLQWMKITSALKCRFFFLCDERKKKQPIQVKKLPIKHGKINYYTRQSFRKKKQEKKITCSHTFLKDCAYYGLVGFFLLF